MSGVGVGIRGGPTGALERIRGWALNLDWPQNLCYSAFFTDLIHQCNGFLVKNNVGSVVSYTADPTTGWPTNVPSSGSVTIFIKAPYDTTYDYFRPGTYKARMDATLAAAGWVCQLQDTNSSAYFTGAAAGSTNISTIADQGSGSYNSLNLILVVTAPVAGGSLAVGKAVQLYIQSQEAYMDALDDKSWFAPDFISDVQGVKLLRCKDWSGIDCAANAFPDTRKLGVCTVSDLRPMSNFTWTMATFAPSGGMVPYQVQAKLGKVLGCAIQVHFPLFHNRVSFNCTAAGNTIIPSGGHNYPDGSQVSFASSGGFLPSTISQFAIYYTRDTVAGVSFSVSTTPGGPAVTIPFDQNNANTYDCNVFRIPTDTDIDTLYNNIAATLFAESPNGTFVVDVGNENWNVPQPYGWDQCTHCLTLKTNGFFNDGSGYSYLLQRAWMAMEKLFPRDQIIRIVAGQTVQPGVMAANAYNYFNANLYDGKKMIDLIDAQCCDGYAYGSLSGGGATGKNQNDDFATMAYALTGTDYNFWVNPQSYVVGDVVHMTDGNNYLCILPNSGQTPPNATYWQLLNPTVVGDQSTWTDNQILQFCILSNKQLAYYRNAYRIAGEALRTNPIPLGYIAYEGGFYEGLTFFNLGASTLPWGAKWKTWLGTDAARQMMVDYFNQVVKGSKTSTLCQYMYAGQWRNDNANDCVPFGTKRAHNAPDNSMSAWCKTGFNVK